MQESSSTTQTQNECPICRGTKRVQDPNIAAKGFPAIKRVGYHNALGLPCPVCRPDAVEAAISVAEEKEVDSYLNRSGMPEKFRGVTMDDFVTDPEALQRLGLKASDANQRLKWKNVVREYLDGISENLKKGVGLTLTGSVGTGKTLLLYIVAGGIIRSKKDFVTIIPERFIFDSVKATYGHNEGESEGSVVRRFETIRNLMIDDFGVRKATEWMTDIYHSIIDARWDAGLPTFISSNLPISELTQIYPRQMDRLKKNVAIEMVGGSLRGTKLER